MIFTNQDLSGTDCSDRRAATNENPMSFLPSIVLL